MKDEKLKELKKLLKTQGKDGTWNLDEYMRGIYNGLELAVATLEDRDPVYRSMDIF